MEFLHQYIGTIRVSVNLLLLLVLNARLNSATNYESENKTYKYYFRCQFIAPGVKKIHLPDQKLTKDHFADGTDDSSVDPRKFIKPFYQRRGVDSVDMLEIQESETIKVGDVLAGFMYYEVSEDRAWDIKSAGLWNACQKIKEGFFTSVRRYRIKKSDNWKQKLIKIQNDGRLIAMTLLYNDENDALTDRITYSIQYTEVAENLEFQEDTDEAWCNEIKNPNKLPGLKAWFGREAALHNWKKKSVFKQGTRIELIQFGIDGDGFVIKTSRRKADRDSWYSRLESMK